MVELAVCGSGVGGDGEMVSVVCVCVYVCGWELCAS